MKTQTARKGRRRGLTVLAEGGTGLALVPHIEEPVPLSVMGLGGLGEVTTSSSPDALDVISQEALTDWDIHEEGRLSAVALSSKWLTDLMESANEGTPTERQVTYKQSRAMASLGGVEAGEHHVGAQREGQRLWTRMAANLRSQGLDARQRAVRASLEVLQAIGQRRVADRVADLERFRRQERDDGSTDELLAIESLMSVILFLRTGPKLSEPHVTMTTDGTLFCEWPLKQAGKIILLFRKDARITYVIKGPKSETGEKRYRVRGTDCQAEVVKAIGEVAHWLPGA